MKRILSLLLILTIVLSCSTETVIPTLEPEPTPKYFLVIAASEGGSVNSTGGTYDKGTKVTVTATPDGEYLFDSWSDGSTENPREITVTSNLDLTANFIKKKYSLSISTSGEGTVTEEVLVQGSVSDYNSGTKIRLTAVPNTDEDWEFIGWEGDVESNNPIIEIDVTEAKTVEAKFMRYFNYMVPSYIWKNNIQPRLNLFEIEEANGLQNEYISTTGYAIADFNQDGYLDLMAQSTANSDDAPRGHLFFINDGSGNYLLDNSLFINPGFESLGARKTIVGDFNNDDYPDVIRISGAHDVLDESTILLSANDGTYEMMKIPNVPKSQYHGFASGDIDNDGDLDLFFGSPENDQGFAINDGSANFSFEPSTSRINNLPENTALNGVQTAEMLDYNEDGYIDLLLGGSFADEPYDTMLIAPSIIWGDGSGFYDYSNRSAAFQLGEKPYINDIKTGNNDDLVFFDIDGDGFKEIIALFIIQIDNDPNNNGNTTMYSFIQIYSPDANYSFANKTSQWFTNDEYLFPFPVTWIQIRDIDSNGNVDIVESESVISRPGYWTSGNESIHFEWNGSSFVKVN